MQTLGVCFDKRTPTSIRIDPRPIDEPQRVGLSIPPGARIIQPVPVVGEAAFDQELLPRKAQVLLDSAGQGLHLAEGGVARLPDGGLRRTRHADGLAQMVGVDEGQHPRRRVHPRHQRQRIPGIGDDGPEG
jgi:hypothetical protein